MLQKTIWMPYLRLGIIISLTILINSCGTDRYGQTGEFYFVNETNYHITYPKGFEKYNIAPMSTIKFNESQFSGKESAEPSDFKSPLVALDGKITISFDQKKCIVNETRGNVHSVMDISNYTAERKEKRTYRFTYTFTEADYNRAITCP